MNSETISSSNQKRTKIPAPNVKPKEETLKKKEASGLPSLDSIVEDLMQKLNVQENVADLVMVSMAYLPDQMPSKFQSTYKPISAAGTSNQIRTLARMLAFQLNEAGLLSFSESSASKMMISLDDLDNDEDIENEDGEFENKISKNEILDRSDSLIEIKNMTKLQRGNSVINSANKARPGIESLMSKKSNIKTFKLSDITNNSASEFNTKTLEELLKKTYNRILNSEGKIYF